MNWSSLFSALIGGLLALGGQWVQAGIAGRGEVRRRGEAAAIAARDVSQQIEMLRATNRESNSDELTVEGETQRSALLNRFRGEALLIHDTNVRERLLFIASALGDPYGIRDFYGDRESMSTWRLCRWAEQVLGSYLRREKQPSEPSIVGAYAVAMAEADEMREEQYGHS